MPRTKTNYGERNSKSCKYVKWVAHLWEDRAQEIYKQVIGLKDPAKAICYVFGSYCKEALAVSWCESHHHTTSQNGQYLGLFQMGSSERATYGHSDTALGQSIAAHRYFIASGSDWSPWSCKPY